VLPGTSFGVVLGLRVNDPPVEFGISRESSAFPVVGGLLVLNQTFNGPVPDKSKFVP